MDFDLEEFNFKEININASTKPVTAGKTGFIQSNSNNMYLDGIFRMRKFTADCYIFNFLCINKTTNYPDVASHIDCLLEVEVMDLNYSTDSSALTSASYLAPFALVSFHDLLLIVKGKKFINRSPNNVSCIMHTTGNLTNIARGYMNIEFDQFKFMGEYPIKSPDVTWNGYSNPFSCGNGDTFMRIVGNIVLEKAPHAFHTYGSYTEFAGNIQYGDANLTPVDQRKWHIKTNPAYGPTFTRKGSVFVRNISLDGLLTNGINNFETITNTANVEIFGNADLIRQKLSAAARNIITSIKLYAASYHTDINYSNAPFFNTVIEIVVETGEDILNIPVLDKSGTVIHTIVNEDKGKIIRFNLEPSTRSMVYDI
jgi:hypothetical protein